MSLNVRRGVAVGVMAAVAFLGALAPLEGQVRLIPQIGVYSAVEDPGAVQGVGGAYEIGKYESTLAYGGSLEFGGDRGASFRFSGLYAPEAETIVSGLGCQAGCPAGVDLLSVTGSLVFRPLGELFFLQPYVLAGGGLKRFDYEPENFGEGIGQVFSDESEWAGLLGIGAEVDLGGAAFTFEVSDHFHWTDRGIVNGDRVRMDDFFFTVGLILGR